MKLAGGCSNFFLDMRRYFTRCSAPPRCACCSIAIPSPTRRYGQKSIIQRAPSSPAKFIVTTLSICLRNIGNPPHYRAQASYRNFGEWIAADLDGFLAHYIKYRASALEWAATGADENNLHTALDLAFMTYIGSEFDPSFWIDRCCDAVREEERDRLRTRLRQNLSGAGARGASPSIRGAVRELAGAIVRAVLDRSPSRIRAAIQRTRWRRLTSVSQKTPSYDIHVRRSVASRFSSEQLNLLSGIERHD